jgi:hypothetical protein
MALDPSYFFYSDGTITLTNGSDIATGEMVAWDPALLPFDFVFPNDGTAGATVIKEVLTVNQIRLAKPWTGPTLTDVPYFALRFANHIDPRFYAVRVSEYLARLKALPENLDEVADEIHADRVAVEAAMTLLAQIQTEVDADRQVAQNAAGTAQGAATAATHQAGIAQQWAEAASSAILPDNGVTNAKLADMAAARIKGRISAGAGDPEDLTPGQVYSILTAGTGLLGSNLLINSFGDINQRNTANGANAAGAFVRDRWKAGAGGANISVSNGTWTLTSGSIEQIVEIGFLTKETFANGTLTVAVNDLTGGNLAVTAGGQSGTITAGPGIRSATLLLGAGATGNIWVTFSGSGVTFRWPRAGRGSNPALIVERDELRLCQRYYERGVLSVLGYPPVSGGYVIQTITYKATKRAAPQVAVIAASQSTNISAVSIDDVTLEGCRYVATAGASGLLVGRGTWEATVEL